MNKMFYGEKKESLKKEAKGKGGDTRKSLKEEKMKKEAKKTTKKTPLKKGVHSKVKNKKKKG